MASIGEIRNRNQIILQLAKELKSRMSSDEHSARLKRVLKLGIEGPTFAQYCEVLESQLSSPTTTFDSNKENAGMSELINLAFTKFWQQPANIVIQTEDSVQLSYNTSFSSFNSHTEWRYAPPPDPTSKQETFPKKKALSDKGFSFCIIPNIAYHVRGTSSISI